MELQIFLLGTKKAVPAKLRAEEFAEPTGTLLTSHDSCTVMKPMQGVPDTPPELTGVNR